MSLQLDDTSLDMYRWCMQYIETLTTSETQRHRISVKKQSTQPIDDTFSSNLERLTFPHDDLIQAHNLYKPNASMGLVYKMQGGNRREKPGEFGPLRCDIKCEYESGAGLINQQWVYGTNWQFHVGIEGSVSYS